MERIRVGGVPEHFNYPWHLGIERGYFTKFGVFVDWTDYKTGTGAMITALLDGQVDVIVALTEGLVSEIIKGAPIQIFGTYVKSPLHWAVITGKNSPYMGLEDLKQQDIGISRFTSGSHIMTCVLAGERGWHPQNDVNFKVVGSFENLRNSVNSGETAAFLWEHFTTQPFVDSGEVRFVDGDITTPWSCFMLAGRKDFLRDHDDLVRRTLKGLREASEFFHHTSDVVVNIAENYGLTLENAKKWYKTVNITASSGIAESSLVRVVDALFQSKVTTSKDFPITNLIAPHLAEIETDIKHMKLYSKPELLKYLRNSLIAIGKATGPLDFTELLPYDQGHYYGVAALDENVHHMGIQEGSRVINIGSGLGGPSRYLAAKYGCFVLAIELQDDLHRAAKELTERCGLKNNVIHMAGDFLEVGTHLKENHYDSIVSWLTLLHIQNREKVLEIAFSLLRPGGVFFAEDFYKLHVFTQQEVQTLQYEVSCPYVPDLNTYKNQLRKAGFEVVAAEDLTPSWKDYTAARVEKFEADKENILKVQRQDTYNRLLFFYTQIRDLFAGGNLGGARFIARKPKPGPKQDD